MTICRYFVQGYCRFGDRCRFEHIQTNYDSYNYNQRNVGNYQERYGKQDAGYSNYNRNDNQYRNQRYESRGYFYEDQRGYSPERYSENYHHQSPMERSGYDNHQQNRYRQGFEHQTRFNEQNYGRNQQQYSTYHENSNTYGQNRYRWLADDYKTQTHQRVESDEEDYVRDSYRTSTPKGKTSFSFRVPESEIKTASSTHIQINEQDQLYADIVKEDAKSWELGGQWPFTCYFPVPNKHGYPGFYDVSPEELRHAAYKAEKNNSYETYLQAVQNALAQVNQQRSQLQVPTPQLLSTLRRIRNGEDLYSTSKMIDPIPSITCNDSSIECMETPAPESNAAASFSFRLPTETDSASKTSSANFSFKLPAGTEIKTVSTAVPDDDPDIYTPMEKLTEEEIAQFSASTFILGKIPTKPPPRVFCI